MNNISYIITLIILSYSVNSLRTTFIGGIMWNEVINVRKKVKGGDVRGNKILYTYTFFITVD